MQTLANIQAIVSEIQFKDWKLNVREYSDKVPYLQVTFMDKDRITGAEELQRCRKWVLSYHMVDSEIIRTAYKAIETAMIHEVQEEFRYKGVRLFNPHLDLNDLVAVIKEHSVGISIRDEETYKG